jgi:signal peptidase I
LINADTAIFIVPKEENRDDRSKYYVASPDYFSDGSTTPLFEAYGTDSLNPQAGFLILKGEPEYTKMSVCLVGKISKIYDKEQDEEMYKIGGIIDGAAKSVLAKATEFNKSIDKGDVIVYEEYKNQYIEEDDIIVFNYNGLTTIHRVIDVEYVNGQTRYYTKGDANAKADDGYRVDSDIEGVLNFNVKYVGYPTLWLRDIFK